MDGETFLGCDEGVLTHVGSDVPQRLALAHPREPRDGVRLLGVEGLDAPRTLGIGREEEEFVKFSGVGTFLYDEGIVHVGLKLLVLFERWERIHLTLSAVRQYSWGRPG